MILTYEHLLGRGFEHGKQDCYSLVRDFYQDNFGLTLTDYARPDDWWWSGLNLYADNFHTEGFRVVDDHPRDYRPADLFLIAVKSEVPNHAAIHLGDGRILHHFYGRFSEVIPYKGIWRNNTTAVIRHKDVPDLRKALHQVDLREFLPAHKRRLIDDALE